MFSSSTPRRDGGVSGERVRDLLLPSAIGGLVSKVLKLSFDAYKPGTHWDGNRINEHPPHPLIFQALECRRDFETKSSICLFKSNSISGLNGTFSPLSKRKCHISSISKLLKNNP